MDIPVVNGGGFSSLKFSSSISDADPGVSEPQTEHILKSGLGFSVIMDTSIVGLTYFGLNEVNINAVAHWSNLSQCANF